VGLSGPEFGHSTGLKVAQFDGMRFPTDPESPENNDDPFAEFLSEPEKVPETPKNQDWMAEFPDEKASPIARPKTWGQLSRSLNNEPERR
jgi:hypothetical protein